MTTRGYQKRACAVVLLKHVKSPIKLAREMLLRGGRNGHHGEKENAFKESHSESESAQGHLCLGGETAERLAKAWGLEMVDKDYFWTKKRWQQHRRGLKKDHDQTAVGGHLVDIGADFDDSGFVSNGDDWDGIEYLPQGTTGCVALDQTGMICVATSTGGMTNKLPCRIGDTPTIGAGFWAEQWNDAPLEWPFRTPTAPFSIIRDSMYNLGRLLETCLPQLNSYSALPSSAQDLFNKLTSQSQEEKLHAVAVSGTGNGDSFLKLSAARTVGAIVRFSYPSVPPRTLASAFNQIVGPGGEMQRSSGDQWGETGEGEGGMIGIELKGRKANVCWDFNCGGMFRCWGGSSGTTYVGVFREEEVAK